VARRAEAVARLCGAVDQVQERACDRADPRAELAEGLPARIGDLEQRRRVAALDQARLVELVAANGGAG
jgi:hypothetical protein